ncbi:hypothetical protein D3C81_1763580 [compost metagenome]
MAALGQRVGASQHEQRAVEHVAHVEHPRMGRTQRVAGKNLVADDQCQHDDQPRRRLADEGADPVDPEQELLHGDAFSGNGEEDGRRRARAITRAPPPAF